MIESFFMAEVFQNFLHQHDTSLPSLVASYEISVDTAGRLVSAVAIRYLEEVVNQIFHWLKEERSDHNTHLDELVQQTLVFWKYLPLNQPIRVDPRYFHPRFLAQLEERLFQCLHAHLADQRESRSKSSPSPGRSTSELSEINQEAQQEWSSSIKRGMSLILPSIDYIAPGIVETTSTMTTNSQSNRHPEASFEEDDEDLAEMTQDSEEE